MTPAQCLNMILVYERAKEVFGNSEKAVAWMWRADKGLNYRDPMDLILRDDTGPLFDELGRIEHGIFA